MLRLLALALALVLGLPLNVSAAPRPKQDSGRLDLDLLGFNEGGPYRLEGALAEAILGEKGAALFRFESKDWMTRSGEGAYVPVSEVVARYPARSASELISVFRFDLDGDQTMEVLLVADNAALGGKRRYAPTVLRMGKDGLEPAWASDKLPGERFRLLDARDLNRDGRLELVLASEAGKAGYYHFHQVIGQSGRGLARLEVKHVDSVHYVDLDRDEHMEIVVRERVGRRGPAYQWTYVDKLFHWDGKAFISVDQRYPRYHDEETLPTLLAGLVDHFDAKGPILDEKVEAIVAVRKSVLKHIKPPRAFERRLLKALSALQKDQTAIAEPRLEELHRQYPYEPQVHLGLARLAAEGESWNEVLDYAIQALTITPRDRRAWWWAGVAFSQLEERSSALASFYNLVNLGESRKDGLAYLRARRGEPGMEERLQRAIDETLAAF